MGSALAYLALPLAVSVAGLVAVGGCGTASSAPGSACNLDPFQCASGTTCDISTCKCTTQPCSYEICTPQFACLQSVPSNGVGASCTTQVGGATCGDGLTCVVEMGAGVCTPYCDTNQPCPMGLVCQELTVKLGPSAMYPVIHVCQAPGADGSFLEIDSGSSGGPPPPVDAALDTPRFDVVLGVDRSAM